MKNILINKGFFIFVYLQFFLQDNRIQFTTNTYPITTRVTKAARSLSPARWDAYLKFQAKK